MVKNVKKQPITAKTKSKFNSSLLSNIKHSERLADNLRNGIDTISEFKETIKTIDDTDIYEELSNTIEQTIKLTDYTLLLCLISLDISVAFRIYINSKGNYETIYSAKQLIITSNEGIKKTYHYISINKKGEVSSKNRNNSFWIKNIGKIVENNHPDKFEEFNKITGELNLFINKNSDESKAQRDLFIHYDNDPVKVYDQLIKLDIEEVTVKTIPFIEIVSRMINFSNSIVNINTNLINKNIKNYLQKAPNT